MGKRINLTKTDLFLLGLTVLFLLAVALTWLLMPRTARGDYEIEAEQPTEDAAQLRMVNINTAGVDELDSLPGIGPVLAQRILNYRSEHGPFASLSELTNVEGIGLDRLEKLWDYATVGGSQ